MDIVMIQLTQKHVILMVGTAVDLVPINTVVQVVYVLKKQKLILTVSRTLILLIGE